MTILSAHDLHKAFGPKTVLDAVTFTLEQGERVGLVGNNGSGKSTLARILAGLEQPDTGVVARRRNASIVLLDQEPVFDSDATVRSIVLSGLRAWSEAKARYDEASEALTREKDESAMAKWLAAQTEAAAAVEQLGGWDRMHQVESILGHVGLQKPEAKAGSLSGGEKRRLALARILISPPDLAILDEPTNHLDVDTIEWLEQWLMNEYSGALLLITHDRTFLDRVVTKTLELERGNLYSYDGGYETYLEAKAERQAQEERVEQNRQNFLRRELEWLRRQPKARTGKQKARISRAQDAIATDAPKADAQAQFRVETSRAGKIMLELRNLSMKVGERVLFQRLTRLVGKGERIGIVGHNGTGKTTLLRAIAGLAEPAEGEVILAKNTQIAYFDQHRANLDEGASIFDNVGGDKERIAMGERMLDVATYLERYFLFDRMKQKQPVGSLSGGERARVALAKMLSQSANLVLLDEPTNDLDVATLSAVEEMLMTFEGAAIVVTHDRWFLNRVATAILAFEEQPDGLCNVVAYAGNYDNYLMQKQEAEAQKAAEAAEKSSAKADRALLKETNKETNKSQASKPPAPKKAGLNFAEKKELSTIFERIEAAEADVSALEAELSSPALYATRASEVPALTAKLEEARKLAAQLSARWEELEAKQTGA